jgi:AcrR family transcriptional regulator
MKPKRQTRETPKPKKRGRDLVETRREILSAAFDEIHAQGFRASSLDAILERTHLTKGALFHQFASKLELGYAVVDEVLHPLTQARWVEPLAAFEDPLAGILHLLEANIAAMPQPALDLGCPVNNLVQEMAHSDPRFRRHLRRLMVAWIDGVAAHLARGQTSGHVRTSANARSVAEYVVLSFEGAFGVIKGMGDKSVLLALKASMETYFASIKAARQGSPITGSGAKRRR